MGVYSIRAMIFKFFVFVVLIVNFNIIFSVNQMPIVWETHGEQVKDRFGTSITTLDFNADGYNDLAVLSLRYDPAPPGTISEPHSVGRVYFYMGGPDSLLSRTPALSITRDVFKDSLGLFRKLLSSDINGDGFKDLIVRVGGLNTNYNPYPSAIGGFYVFYSGASLSR
jgi:hypothetical protein